MKQNRILRINIFKNCVCMLSMCVCVCVLYLHARVCGKYMLMWVGGMNILCVVCTCSRVCLYIKWGLYKLRTCLC